MGPIVSTIKLYYSNFNEPTGCDPGSFKVLSMNFGSSMYCLAVSGAWQKRPSN